MSKEKISYYVENLDNIPETLQEHYVEDNDGGYVLNVAGVAPKKKLDEFRDNNKKLQKQLDDLEFVNVDEYKNLKAAAEKDSTKGLVQEHDVDELVNSRVTEMRSLHEQELAKIIEQHSNTQRHLSEVLIDNAIATTANKHRIKDNAIDDVLARAKNVFRIESGEVIAYNTDGEKAYNKNGEALSITDFISGLEKSASHLFQESTGAGTLGNKPTFAKPKTQVRGLDLIEQGLQERRG